MPLGAASAPLYSDLESQLRSGQRVVLLTHSQGGLVAQRAMLEFFDRGLGRLLDRVSGIVFLACPHQGSTRLGSIWLAYQLLSPSPQGRGLRPLMDDERVHQRFRDHALVATRDDYHWPIPVSAIHAIEDKWVTAQSAQGSIGTANFYEVSGRHESIHCQPTTSSAYQRIRNEVSRYLSDPGESAQPRAQTTILPGSGTLGVGSEAPI